MFAILASNIYFWSHFAVIFFNLVDFVKDVTFATAVKHYDTNIIQSGERIKKNGTEPYQEYEDFNVYYVFLISVNLMVAAQLITYLYWSMITRKPAFLMPCKHQGLVTRFLLQLVQYIPSTLPIVLFAEDSSVKLSLGEEEDSVMDPNNYHRNMELLNEERLLEKLALNIKIIEVVVEAYGQLIIQSVVLLRLKAIITTDYYKYFGISFEYVIIISMVTSIFSIFTTFWSYHIRSKQYFRQAISSYTFLQLITWILLITTKLVVYVFAFMNFPALFFVPVLVQFFVTALILSFSNVSPSFKASAWHDRMIHCMVCCVLPLAMSECPQWQPQDICAKEVEEREANDGKQNDVEEEEEGNGNVAFEDDGINLDSFTSTAQIIKTEKSALKRVDTVSYQVKYRNPKVMKNFLQADMEKKSRGEMLLALFLYTLECFSVLGFSALMYEFYHFERYQANWEGFVKEHVNFFGLLPAGVPGFYGVVIGLAFMVKPSYWSVLFSKKKHISQVIAVVLISGLLILTYYQRLHPRLTMFSVQREGRHSPRNS